MAEQPDLYSWLGVHELPEYLTGSGSASQVSQGFQYLQEGCPDKARGVCEQALAADASDAAAMHLLGLVELQEGNIAQAIDWLGKSVQREPRNAAAFFNLGQCLLSASQFVHAGKAFERCLQLGMDTPGVRLGMARSVGPQGQFEPALQHLEVALANVDALPPSEASLAWMHRGMTLGALGRTQEAVESFGQAVRMNPQLAQAYFGMGTALRSLGMRDAAEKALEQAIAIDDSIAPAHLMLGMLLGERYQHEKALACYDRALALAPKLADAHYGRGLVWQAQGEYGLAGRAFTEALAINPDHVHSLHAMANALIVTRQFALASQMLARADALHPGFDYVAGMRVFLARQLCDWQMHPADLNGLRERALAGERVLKPFAALALFDDPALHRNITANYMRHYHPKAYQQPAQRLLMQAADKIRIAYVSSDFFNHATAYLLAGLLEQHDRAAFEIFALSFGAEKSDAMRARIRAACDEFIDINHLSDAEVAHFCRERNIHIAVDLKGLTRDSRPGIFAYRAAPVQVNWLGYPGTMDAPCYDYIIADATVIPPEQRTHYSEAVVYMPYSYQVNDSRRVISERQQSMAEYGLPETAFVFCCFNNHYKITPEIFACWMRILKQVPGSVLWLLESHEDAHRNLRMASEHHGIEGERLIFAPQVDLPEHLARHRLAQLNLDTLPYNAHTTASDALWAGLPHLTCVGAGFAGRVAASLLRAIGMPEMVAHDLAAYERMAIDMARQPELLEYVHWKLAELLPDAPLFDSRLFAADIEAAYSRMYQQHLFGKLPQDIYIKALND